MDLRSYQGALEDNLSKSTKEPFSKKYKVLLSIIMILKNNELDEAVEAVTEIRG